MNQAELEQTTKSVGNSAQFGASSCGHGAMADISSLKELCEEDPRSGAPFVNMHQWLRCSGLVCNLFGNPCSVSDLQCAFFPQPFFGQGFGLVWYGHD